MSRPTTVFPTQAHTLRILRRSEHHPTVSGEELGESRLTKLRGTHLAESAEYSCEVLLGLESTCNGYIEDACVFFYQQFLGSPHPCNLDRWPTRKGNE